MYRHGFHKDAFRQTTGDEAAASDVIGHFDGVSVIIWRTLPILWTVDHSSYNSAIKQALVELAHPENRVE